MATYAYWSVLLGVFVTAFYSFRLVFMTFHGEERFSTRIRAEPIQAARTDARSRGSSRCR